MGSDRTVDIVVVIGGGTLHQRARAAVPPDALVIAADSGLDVALEAGMTPSVLVGDLDSVSAGGLAWAERHRIPIERHPADKAATDTELALRRATTVGGAVGGAARLLLVCAMGDRLDHAIGALAALGSAPLSRFEAIDAWFGETEMRVVHPGRRTILRGAPGSTFSLVALHGTCRGVHVSPARWPLSDATLEPASTLGISNEIVSRPAEVRVGDGVVTVIVPAPASPAPASSSSHHTPPEAQP